MRLKVIVSLILMSLAACAVQPPTVDKTEKQKTSAPVTLNQLDPDYLYLAAQNALNQGNHAMAAQLLDVLVQKDPRATLPRLQLAALLLQMGEMKSAETHLQKLRLSTDALTKQERIRMHALYARLLAARQQWSEALNELVMLQQEAPDNEEAYILEAQVHMARKHSTLALQAIDEGLEHHVAPRLLLLKAKLLMNTGNLEQAERTVKRLRKIQPENDAAVLLQGEIAVKQHVPGRREQLYREFLREYPAALRVGNALGRLLINENRIREAVKVYKRLASQTGGNVSILKTLGLLYFQQGDYVQAEKVFHDIEAQSSQQDEDVNFYLASSLEAQGKFDAAYRKYQQIEEGAKHFYDAQLRLAAIDIRQQQVSKGEQRIRKVLQKKPSMLQAWEMLSGLLLEQKQYAQLIRETDAIASTANATDSLLYNRAVAFEFLARYQDMEASLGRILKHNPRHAESLNFLGYSLADRGVRLDEAETLIRRALDIRPDNPYYLDSLAWVYYRQGRVEDAVVVQQKALAKLHDDPVMHEHLGDMFRNLGKRRKAAEEYHKALELNHNKPMEIKEKLSRVQREP